MSVAEQIYLEAKRLPEPIAREVLDFIGYLEAKHGLAQATKVTTTGWDVIRLDTRGWRFDREEANER
jgi:hypothetical protein